MVEVVSKAKFLRDYFYIALLTVLYIMGVYTLLYLPVGSVDELFQRVESTEVIQLGPLI